MVGLGGIHFPPCFVIRKVSAIAGIYGWSQKIDSSTLLATTILEGGHLAPFRGEANLAAIADGVAAMVAAAAIEPVPLYYDAPAPAAASKAVDVVLELPAE